MAGKRVSHAECIDIDRGRGHNRLPFKAFFLLRAYSMQTDASTGEAEISATCERAMAIVGRTILAVGRRAL
ncbi:MAG: hypothetical protein OJF58_004405 [Enhydrobacter sp.]|jgi:hypothetical protein|nr:MAG: hypothetical protein OJF58_004405 [Enhydrobacter sp.]